MACAAAARCSLLNPSRAASAAARNVSLSTLYELRWFVIVRVYMGPSSPRKRAIQYSSALATESRSRGVLDTPLSRSMTVVPGGNCDHKLGNKKEKVRSRD